MTTPVGRVAFIGAGNMGRALIGALLRGGVPASSIAAADPEPLQRERARALGAIRIEDDNDAVVRDADTIVLAVKPQSMASVCRALRLRDGVLVLSIAAGVGLSTLERLLGERPIVRAMPNTPALLGAGVTAIAGNRLVTDADRARAAAIVGAAGRVVVLDDERLLDPVTAVSGSGPAYFFLLMESMIEAAKSLGLTAADAATLVTQTALGAARMAIEGDAPVAELRAQVTSKNGTTERALASFAQDGFDRIVARAVRAANARAIEIGKELAEG